MREVILSEIKRLAADGEGVAPGQNAFTKATGISAAKWRGVHWLKWSDALAEAGFAPNAWQKKLDGGQVLSSLAALTRRLGRLPTRTEIKMERRKAPDFPSHSTVSNHYRTNAEMNDALLHLASSDDNWSDLSTCLVAAPVVRSVASTTVIDGFVYLLKSGTHYKIGRSEDIERRFREVKIALPEAVTLVHAIRTDDPSGIEAYWHRRFADRRANGEWFSLIGNDVKAFCRRSFQ